MTSSMGSPVKATGQPFRWLILDLFAMGHALVVWSLTYAVCHLCFALVGLVAVPIWIPVWMKWCAVLGLFLVVREFSEFEERVAGSDE